MFVLLLGGGASLRASGLPPIPADANFVQDFADMLSPETESEIGRIQKEAFEVHRTPIVVVIIESMSGYGRSGVSIEQFAREWFDHWQIGARTPDGELVNQGILLIVSQQDREARIELGADWGRRWDSHAARIMDERIVPRFKRGDFDGGIYLGAMALGEMAALGPEATSPGGIADMIPPAWREEPLSTSPLPGWAIWAMVIAGVVCIAASFGFPAQRKILLIVGLGLILTALVFWLVVVILSIIFRFTGRGDSDGSFSGGYSNSRGFGTGGFSGGGGASGRW
jgi:uncharacterized protein